MSNYISNYTGSEIDALLNKVDSLDTRLDSLSINGNIITLKKNEQSDPIIQFREGANTPFKISATMPTSTDKGNIILLLGAGSAGVVKPSNGIIRIFDTVGHNGSLGYFNNDLTENRSYNLPDASGTLALKEDSESGLITTNNLAWYKNDSSYSLTGSYRLINDMCILRGYARVINGWGDVHYSLPIAAVQGSSAISFENGNQYIIHTGTLDNISILTINKLDGSNHNTDDTIQFVLIYKYK